MAVTVKDVYRFLDEKAPFELQMDFDNAGFLVGRSDRAVDTVLVALDITDEVIEEATELGAQLIVAHHPVIFAGEKSLTDQTPNGDRLLRMAELGIAAICAHTNLDAVEGGVNDALALALGLTDIGQLKQEGMDKFGRPYGIGRVGTLPVPADCVAFAAAVKDKLAANGVRYVDCGRAASKVAVGGGSCSDMVDDALALGCDTFVTSDVKYHTFLEAREKGINLIDAGHYPTENVVCPVLAGWLKEKYPQLAVAVSARHKEVFSYL